MILIINMQKANISPIFQIDHVKENPIMRMQWSKEFDNYLIELMKGVKAISWNRIAEQMCIRFPQVKFTAKKCRGRWRNSVDPVLHKEPMNNSEQIILFAYHYQYKNQWTSVEEIFH